MDMQHLMHLTLKYKRRLTDFFKSVFFSDTLEAYLIPVYLPKRRDLLSASKSSNLFKFPSAIPHINIFVYFHIFLYIHTHIYMTFPHLPLLYFSVVPLAKDKDLNGFQFCFVLPFSPQKSFPLLRQTKSPAEHHPNCPRQLDPFKLNALQLQVLWLNPLVRGRAENVCSSPTTQHITSEIQYKRQFLRPESIIAIKHSPPCCTEQLTLMPKSSVPRRLLLIQKSARFSHRSNSSSAKWTILCPPPDCPLSRVSLTLLPLLLNLSLNNSASFPVPFFSSHIKTECTVIRSTGIHAISLFPDLNLIFQRLARFQSWAGGKNIMKLQISWNI